MDLTVGIVMEQGGEAESTSMKANARKIDQKETLSQKIENTVKSLDHKSLLRKSKGTSFYLAPVIYG